VRKLSVKTVVEVVIESAHLPDDLGINAPYSLTAKSSCDAHGSTPGSDGVVQHQFSLPVVNNQSAPARLRNRVDGVLRQSFFGRPVFSQILVASAL